MKQTIALITISILIALIITHRFSEQRKFKVMPDGWSIVCNETGLYGAQMPSGYVIDEMISGNPIKTKQDAIDRAWIHVKYEFESKMEAARKMSEPKHDWTKTDE